MVTTAPGVVALTSIALCGDPAPGTVAPGIAVLGPGAPGIAVFGPRTPGTVTATIAGGARATVTTTGETATVQTLGVQTLGV